MLNTNTSQNQTNAVEERSETMSSENPVHSIVSFFSGCGGLDLGFLGDFTFAGEEIPKLPFRIHKAYESNEKSVESYNNYFEHKAEVKIISEQSVLDMPYADVLIGGFPCQDFSSCGPLLGTASERGRLYLSLAEYMKIHRPKIVVAENVRNLERVEGGEAMKTIVESFEGAGYRFEVWRLHAQDFGVPQNRTRLFFIGVRDDIDGHPVEPLPTHKDNHRSIEWAISDLEEISDETVANQSQYFKASKAKNGNGQGDEINKRELPSYTIRANAKSRVHFHYSLDRRLTVRECARLQTFPDNFNFPFSATTNIMQIGNAVPPLLAYHVARSVSEFLKSKQ